MADNKYGRVLTTSDLEKVIEFLYDEEYLRTDDELTVDDILNDMDEKGVRFKFDDDEPVFVLRGHDTRAVGAIKHYLDHQGPRAPENHINGIMAALRSFDTYRQENPGKIKEPD
jgi:hypothetical protein